MNCGIILDLLPLYHDGVCSPESRAEVEAHLKTCPWLPGGPGGHGRAAAGGEAHPAGRRGGGPVSLPNLGEGKTAGLVERGPHRRGGMRGAGRTLGGGYAAVRLFRGPGEDRDYRCAAALRRTDFLYHFKIDDDRNLRLLQFEFEEVDGVGNMYYVPSRALYTEKRQSPSLADSDRYLDLGGSRRLGPDSWNGRRDHPGLVRPGETPFCSGRRGMDLPAASAADEAEWSYSESSAAYWEEHYSLPDTAPQE